MYSSNDSDIAVISAIIKAANAETEAKRVFRCSEAAWMVARFAPSRSYPLRIARGRLGLTSEQAHELIDDILNSLVDAAVRLAEGKLNRH
jgi:hypothetical protein